MSWLNSLATGRYLSSRDPAYLPPLTRLEQQMAHYYQDARYHGEWICGMNRNWQDGYHPAQLAMCRHIPPHAQLLEVGCGDGSSRAELATVAGPLAYTGIDLNPRSWSPEAGFVAGRADALPFPPATFDVVLSMYVIEHLVFPWRFLDEAWRVLRPGGRFLLIAPDFDQNLMPSERVGLGYGSGREKLARGQLLDALLTAYDSRLRLVPFRATRRQQLARGDATFPVLSKPRCLQLEGFTVDCDAVYPASPREIENYLGQKADYGQSNRFYQDSATFGLLITKL